MMAGVYWASLLALTCGVLLALESVLLGLRTGYFSGGFQSVHLETASDLGRFLVGALVLNAALVLSSWTLCWSLLRRFGGGPLRCASMAAIIGIVPAALVSFTRYGVYSVFGRMVTSSLLTASSGDGAQGIFGALGEYLPRSDAALLLASVTAVAIVPYLAYRVDRIRKSPRAEVPRLRTFVLAAGASLLASLVLLLFANRFDPTLHFGISRGASGQLLLASVRAATDWDLDGFGYLSRPTDPAPFDSTIHPYARDIPGNGIDENGVGGDHPADFPEPAASASPVGEGLLNPPFLLILLESFRWDLLGATVDGREITPFLNRLAAEGGSSDRNFVHSPWTLSSRDHLFQGGIAPNAGATTLVDDFLGRGYFVAHFSGQDDSYGKSATRLGFLRADRFYDARQDSDRRTTRTTAPASLQVSWKTLLEQIDGFLSSLETEKPLFLYANIVDTHFPYSHTEVDAIFPDSELTREDIGSDRREEVVRAYANTAANVDRAVERLIGQWRARYPNQITAILITADHGESFYDAGTLGHGQTLKKVETRVPLIVQGIGGDWPEPIAVSDLRQLIAKNLGNEKGALRPRFHVDPQREVFHYLGNLRTPHKIAMRKANGVEVFDFSRGLATQLDRDDQENGEPSADSLQRLIWTWESLQPAE